MSKDLALPVQAARTATLGECVERILSGASVEDCLASFPEEREELAPLLETLLEIRKLRAIEPPLPERVAAGRQRLLARAAELRQQEMEARPGLLADWSSRLRQYLGPWLAPRPMMGRWAVTAVVTLLILVVVGSGAVVAAGTSLPGDPLYPVKRTTQDVRILLAAGKATRAELERQVQAQRREDAVAAAQQKRRVSVDFTGEIESLGTSTWVVSGVTVLVDSQTEIEGPRQTGLTAHVVALSQGDGTLQAQRIVVLAPTPTPTSTPTSGVFLPVTVATETATTAPTPAWSASPSSTATLRPHAAATWAPTPTASPTHTLAPPITKSPSPTAGVTRPPTATVAPPATRVVKVRFEGEIQSKDGNVWLIGGRRVVITDETEIEPPGQAQVGDWVVVTAESQPDGSLRALRITVLRAAATPEVVEFSGPIRSISDQEWVVGKYTVRITAKTTIEGTPQVDATAHVRALRLADGVLEAERIRVESQQQVVQFEGPIQRLTESWWLVGGRWVMLDAYTVVEGTPQVGYIAEVTALVLADGNLLATHITVRPPPPTSTATWTPSPTATTPATATWTQSPIATASPTPDWTPSPVATSSATAPIARPSTRPPTPTPSAPAPTATPSPEAVEAAPTPPSDQSDAGPTAIMPLFSPPVLQVTPGRKVRQGRSPRRPIPNVRVPPAVVPGVVQVVTKKQGNDSEDVVA